MPDDLAGHISRGNFNSNSYLPPVAAGMQEEVAEAKAEAMPPDPALHVREVADLEAACRESRSRVASLQGEARCAPAALCVPMPCIPLQGCLLVT